MRRLSDSNQVSLFASTYCDADVCAPEFIAIDEKALVRERCPGDNRGIVDCHSADINEYIADAGGLDFGTKTITTDTPELPEKLVVIPPECFDWNPEHFPDIVGINIKDILSVKPKLRWGHYAMADGVHISLSALQRPAFRGKKIILFSSYIDVAIEKLWLDRQDISLFQEIANGGFYAVTGMNFSLFLHECPMGQLINLNKSLGYVHELSKLGVPVIPHVYAVNDQQRNKLVEYLKNNPNINTVIMNTQLQRDVFSAQEAVKTVEAILESTGCRVILNGRALKLPATYSERVVIANQHGLKQRVIIERARERLMAQRPSLKTAEQSVALSFQSAVSV
ncbi:MAG: hypothetical protein ACXWLH_05890 [Candidatus Saccharimonadales bacterium]